MSASCFMKISNRAWTKMVLIEIGEEEIWLINSGMDLIAKPCKILLHSVGHAEQSIPLQLDSTTRDIWGPFLWIKSLFSALREWWVPLEYHQGWHSLQESRGKHSHKDQNVESYYNDSHYLLAQAFQCIRKEISNLIDPFELSLRWTIPWYTSQQTWGSRPGLCHLYLPKNDD